MNIKDGYAIQLACKRGLHVAIITGGNTAAVRKRYEGLGVKDIYMGAGVKLVAYEELLDKYQLKDEEVMFVGDDIPDYEVMSRVGCACCPKDVIEQVLKAQGLWMSDRKAFGW